MDLFLDPPIALSESISSYDLKLILLLKKYRNGKFKLAETSLRKGIFIDYHKHHFFHLLIQKGHMNKDSE